jgi:hypothetical protein
VCRFFPAGQKNDTQGIENDWQAKALCMFFFTLRGKKEHTKPRYQTLKLPFIMLRSIQAQGWGNRVGCDFAQILFPFCHLPQQQRDLS